MRRAKTWRIIAICVAACIGLSMASLSAKATGTGPSAGAAAGVRQASVKVTFNSSDQPQSTPCIIGPDTATCTSSDPTLELEWTNFGDTTGCTFNYSIDWGDRSAPQTGQEPGGPTGSYVFVTHTYVKSGTYTVSTTGSVASGNCQYIPGTTQFTLQMCTSAQLSGPSWAAQFPNSRSLSDLSGAFQQDVVRFINAMTAADITESTITTLRPPQRAYLMHYSWLISKGQIDPANVPDFTPAAGQAAVNICWVHRSSNGKEDASASTLAAKQMVGAFGIDRNLKVAPALNSLHTQGLAIDMTTIWNKKTITIVNGSGTSVTIDTTPHSDLNAQLIAVGASYGVIHFLNATRDPNHWSVNGH